MSEKRFTLSNPISHNPIPSWVSIIHDDIEHKHLNAEEICDLLNEQQATIEHLTKSRDKWRELSNSFLFYCKCYEKAIERAFEEKPCPSEEDINRIYEELEKELENE